MENKIYVLATRFSASEGYNFEFFATLKEALEADRAGCSDWFILKKVRYDVTEY
jgi:hypothetical protein